MDSNMETSLFVNMFNHKCYSSFTDRNIALSKPTATSEQAYAAFRLLLVLFIDLSVDSVSANTVMTFLIGLSLFDI